MAPTAVKSGSTATMARWFSREVMDICTENHTDIRNKKGPALLESRAL